MFANLDSLSRKILAIPIITLLWLNISSRPSWGNGHTGFDLAEAHTDHVRKSRAPFAQASIQVSDQSPLSNDLQHDASVFHDPSNYDHFTDLDQSTEVSSESIVDESQFNLSELNDQDNPNQEEDRIFLTQDLIDKSCEKARGVERIEQVKKAYLTNCFRYNLSNLFSQEIYDLMHVGRAACKQHLKEILELDDVINQFDAMFIRILSRYNCHNGYSVKWNCDDCKKAYKDWLCATHLPYYEGGVLIKPCISFCERVEQRCPYLHPIMREQYGGQPVFICRDPNIPFVPEITPDIPYGEPGGCYDLCHLSENSTELTTDTLSKYDSCPPKKAVADEAKKTNPIDTSSYKLTSDEDQNNRSVNQNQADPRMYHIKKLVELREILTNYKNQAKTHRYHADHSSIDQPTSQSDLHH